jgi:hypothetical protein
MPKAGRRRKKTRTHVAEDENAQSALSSAEALKIPKSLVVRCLFALKYLEQTLNILICSTYTLYVFHFVP